MFRRKRRRRTRRRRRAKKTIIQRFFRAFISVIILTAFILGLSYFVKEVSTLDPNKAVKLTSPLLEKAGISKEKAGQVAGDFAERLFRTNIAPSVTFVNEQLEELESGDVVGGLSDNESFSSRETLFRVALMSDAHNNLENLEKALSIARDLGVNSVFFLGDYTDFGESANLAAAKEVMDESHVLYYSLPGDRDLYESVGAENFYAVFGEPHLSVAIGKTKFVLIDNSANYTLIGSDKMGQYRNELQDADYVILAQPLYHPLASYAKPVMGLVKGEIVSDVREQAEEFLTMIRETDVKVVIAADQHSFSRYEDEQKSSLEHVVIGPVTDVRAEQSKPSITVLSVFEDYTYNLEEIFIQ